MRFFRPAQPSPAPRPPSFGGRFLRGFLGWVLPGLGFFLAIGLTVSPAFGDLFTRLFENTVPVTAQLLACEPRRNGIGHSSEIRCRFRYSVDGQVLESEGRAWDSRSPFLTSRGLQQALDAQRAQPQRTAHVRTRQPSDVALDDPRWLAVPPLWVALLAVFIGLMALIVRLDPAGLPWRRADLAPDPETGHLEPVNHHHADRVRRRLVGQALAALGVVGLCLFGLSNQPANLVAKAAMTGLQAVPAQRVDCAHHRRGGTRGHDQIECGFDYVVAGQLFRGQAESLDFRYFPRRARLDAEVARLNAGATTPGAAMTAYVDPRHPGYAWGFIRTDHFVKFTWGLFELQLGLIVAIGLVFVVVQGVRWRRAGR